MQRKHVGIVLILVVIAAGAAVWLSRKDDTAAVPRAGDKQTKSQHAATSPAARSDQVPPPLAEAEEDADPAGPLALEGQVLDDSDAPVAGAKVTLSSNPPRHVTTETDGSFTFDKLIGKVYSVTARKGSLIGGPVPRKLTAVSEPVIIRMKAGASLEVTVVISETGQPVAGATVTVDGDPAQTTDSDGTARFEGVRSGYVNVTAAAAGYASKIQYAEIADTPGVSATATLALSRGAEVSGRVIDAAGEPVAGAKITPVDVSAPFALGGSAAEASSDKTGAFVLPALAAGTYRLVATHKLHAPGSSEPFTADGIAPITGLTVELPAGATLAGKVVDTADQPVAWASVRVMTRKSTMQGWGARVRQAVTDEAGTFEITGLPRSEVQALAVGELAASNPMSINLEATPDKRDVVIVLDVEGKIAGVVVDSTGAAIAETSVLAIPDFFSGDADMETFSLRGATTATTDGDGHFVFGGLRPGSYRVSSSARDGFGARALRGQPAKTGDTDVRIVVQADGGIEGDIRLDDGSTPKLFTVTVGYPPGVPFADGSGAFRLRSLAPGTYDVTFNSPEFAEHVQRGVIVVPGEQQKLGTITIKRGRNISGRVTASGTAIAGATVAVGRQLVGDGATLATELGTSGDQMLGLRRGTTDADGRFQIRGISDGELTIAAEHAAHGRSATAPVAAGSESLEVDLELRGFGSVAGTVTSGGKPVPGAQIVATADGTTKQFSMVNASDKGEYQFERLPEGTYTVMAVMSSGGVGGGDFGKKKTSVRAGDKQQVDIDIEVGDITLLVSYSGLDGVSIDAAQVFWFQGEVTATVAKEIQGLFVNSAGVAKANFAMGAGNEAKLEGVLAGASTLCMLPINGDLSDPSFQKRLQEHADELKVYCKPHAVASSPAEQHATMAIPAMDPLPVPTQ